MVWSHRTLDYYGQDDPKSRYAEHAYGLYSAQAERHVPAA